MRFAFCAVLAAVTLPFCLHAAVVGQNDNNFVQQQPYEDGAHRAGRSDESSAATGNTAVAGNWAMMARIADECAKDPDTTACLAVKAAAALERAARAAGTVQLLPGLTVAKNADAVASRDSRSLPTEDELRNQLQPTGTGANDRDGRVADMLVDSGLRFLQSRTVQFKFPQTDSAELSRAIEEGRGKLKKKVLPILAVLAVKIAAVLPFLLGIIGFFAIKALLFGKLALLIASVLAFQKYSAGSSGVGGFGKIAENFGTIGGNVAASQWSQPAVPSAGGGYYRRSMEQAAQQMAYNGQMQPSVQTAT